MRLTSDEIERLLSKKAEYASPSAYIGRATKRTEAGTALRSMVAYLRTHLFICLLAALFLVGLLIGTLLVGHASESTRDLLQVVLGGYLEKRQVQSFLSIALSTFSASAIVLLVLFFCGFCSISQVIILIIPLFKGLGYGFSIGACYAQYGAPAVPYVLLTLFPAMLFNTLLILCACKRSFLLSLRLLQSAITPTEQSERFRMQKYCIKYAMYTVLCIAIALFDAIIAYQLGSIFVL